MRRHAGWMLGGAIAVALAACTGDEDPGASPTSTTTTTVVRDEEPDRAAEVLESWVGDELPTVASPVAVTGDLAVYFTAVGTDQFVTVVDLAERRELWRRPSHQHGRIRGVIYEPHVDVETDRVVVTTYDDGSRAIELAAFGLRTGEEEWRRPVDWAQSTPYRCVDDTLLCFSTSDGLVAQVDADGGPFSVSVQGGLERTIGGGEDRRLSADPAGGRIELGAIVRGGYETRWQRGVADFVPAPDAARYGPDGGWNADVDDDTGRALFLLGGLPPDDIRDRPEPRLTTEELRASALEASLVGLAGADGTPVLGITGVYGCRDMPFEVEEFWTCEDIGVVEREDYGDDGELDPEPVINRMVKRSDAEPDGELVVELPSSVPFYGGGIQPTSDPDRFLVTPLEGEPLLLDRATGDLEEVGADSDLVAECFLPDEEAADDDPVAVTLRTYDGGTDEYRTVYGPFGLCGLDGVQVDPTDALDRTELSDWFGIGREVDQDDEDHDDLAATSNGWVLWTEVDRVLRVARVAR